jgi:hypothetical protein
VFFCQAPNGQGYSLNGIFRAFFFLGRQHRKGEGSASVVDDADLGVRAPDVYTSKQGLVSIVEADDGTRCRHRINVLMWGLGICQVMRKQ